MYIYLYVVLVIKLNPIVNPLSTLCCCSQTLVQHYLVHYSVNLDVHRTKVAVIHPMVVVERIWSSGVQDSELWLYTFLQGSDRTDALKQFLVPYI